MLRPAIDDFPSNERRINAHSRIPRLPGVLLTFGTTRIDMILCKVATDNATAFGFLVAHASVMGLSSRF